MTNEYKRERLHELYEYLDRLIGVSTVDVRVHSEISEVIAEIRAVTGLATGVEFNRAATFNVVYASKEEGAAFSDMHASVIRKEDSIADRIESLRKDGFQIFHVMRGVGVVDDIISKVSE